MCIRDRYEAGPEDTSIAPATSKRLLHSSLTCRYIVSTWSTRHETQNSKISINSICAILGGFYITFLCHISLLLSWVEMDTEIQMIIQRSSGWAINYCGTRCFCVLLLKAGGFWQKPSYLAPVGRAGVLPLQELAGAAKRATWENICQVGDLISADIFWHDICSMAWWYLCHLLISLTPVTSAGWGTGQPLNPSSGELLLKISRCP